MDQSKVADGLRQRDKRLIARLISLVEDGSKQLEAIVRTATSLGGHAYTVGLTGSPGVGKSTLAAELVGVVRGRERTVSVLAIDPTSPFTGGALLGDRLRMQTHATDPGVFIRSMATRGHLGGLAWAAPHALRILDAAGFDVVVVETVGVGQAEVEVATATDTTVVVLAPGLGDSVQAHKAGLLEVADIFVVNKADREGARDVSRDIEQMLDFGPPREWRPPVLFAQAQDGVGVEEVWLAIESHRAHLEQAGELRRRRLKRTADEITEIALGRLRRAIGSLGERVLVEKLAVAVLDRELDPYGAADRLLDEVGR